MEQVLYKLPDGWCYESLGKLTHIVGGATPAKNQATYWGGGIKWASVRDLHSEELLDTEFKITEEGLKNSSTNIIPPETVVISTRVGLGKVVITKDAVAINQDLKGLLIKGDIEVRYLFYWLKSQSEYIKSAGTGATVKGVKLDFIKNLFCPLPKPNEQKRIVEKVEALLTRIDTAIKYLQESVSLADALYASTLDELSKAVKGKEMKLGELGKVIRGSSPRPKGDPRYYGGNVPRLMVGDVTRDGRFVTPAIDFLTDEGALKSRPVPKGTLTIQVSGNPGMPAILAVDACIHDGFAALIEIDQKRISTEYLYFSLLAVAEQNNQMAVGAIFRNLTTSQLREIKITIPSYEKQLEMVKWMDEAERKVNTLKSELKSQLDAIYRLKASVLDSAFKGEL